jgi:osmoprotectant transport system permease protein
VAPHRTISAVGVNTVREAIEFLLTPDNWTGQRGILARGRAHIWISVVAVTISAVAAIPSAVWLAHKRRAPNLSIAMVNLGRAIPSFAIIALVFPFSIRYGFGLGFWPTCVALVALGIPPMFTNAYSGVMETRDDIVEAASGIGMTGPQVLRKVELPAAVPLLMTGVRVSSVQIVATATLGALVGYECLGTYIVAGLARGPAGRPQVLAGAILVAGLALTVDLVLNSLERVLTPWRPGRAVALP